MNKHMVGNTAIISMALLLLMGVDACGQGYSRTDSFGNTTYNFGGRSGYSRTDSFGNTTFSGDLFRARGASGGSVLFESTDVSSRFSEDAWVGAVENRDVMAMVGAAWELKAVETILGKTDKKTTSETLFKVAAQVAVEQRNEAALAEIVALCPSCKSYESEMKAASPSRGKAAAVTMPQIVYPDLGVFDLAKPEEFKKRVVDMVKQLTPWQTPILTPDLLRFSFRGMSTPEAENVAILVNRGRQTVSPAMLVQAAVSLAGKDTASEYACLEAGRLLDEATGLALLLGDKKALFQIIHIAESDVFGLKDPDQAKTLAEKLKLMSGNRGMPDVKNEMLKPYIQPDYILIPDTGAPRGM